MHEWTHGRIDGGMDGHMGARDTYGWRGWMEGMDGGRDGGMEGWMEG